MKKLIFISGTMGVGKTTTCKELQALLPNSVFLDGDWCWDMQPFVVNDETKAMVINNICFLLNQFIQCSIYDNIIFCWVMHEQEIIDDILSRLDADSCNTKNFSLICSENALKKRLQNDIDCGKRTFDVIERSITCIKCYDMIASTKIDVSSISPTEAAEEIKKILEEV